MLSDNNPTTKPRLSVATLITDGLGYCCPWLFFQLYRKTSVIADRLGVTDRAVRYLKSKVDNHVCTCEGHPHCMKHLLLTPSGKRRRPTTIVHSRDLD